MSTLRLPAREKHIRRRHALLADDRHAQVVVTNVTPPAIRLLRCDRALSSAPGPLQPRGKQLGGACLEDVEHLCRLLVWLALPFLLMYATGVEKHTDRHKHTHMIEGTWFLNLALENLFFHCYQVRPPFSVLRCRVHNG